ncbi:polysaccharide biosynthesis/export family protein [Enterovirga sp.]|uniref:polysaccharide biosynthesis/export family protein n=1 Tax=Enterovirga sp. TaxID=2026350 RepID=UPI00260A13AD|nr:polysaccharide biosynthesis/export family protein [Enterovirga sp.]MDB5592260.1 polysaccharide export protein [Enterovirga sp.]
MNRRYALGLLAAAAALPAGGCFRRPGPVISAGLRGAEAYTLATGDKLRIIVFGQDSLSNIYQIDAAGRISMPLIGPVQVGGLSTASAATAIEGKLRGGFIREPKVTVEVDTYRPFFILGEVTTSGQFPFVNGMTVQTAVAIAGGFTPRADRDVAELTRRTRQGMVRGEVPITYPVRPGDTIVIKERWF